MSHARETFGRIALEKPLRGERTCIAGFHELVLGSQGLIPKLKAPTNCSSSCRRSCWIAGAPGTFQRSRAFASQLTKVELSTL